MIRGLTVFWNKLKANISTEVPANIAACEFDCRKLECSNEEWETCPNRIETEKSINQSMWQGSGMDSKSV